jgi:hypothetical protein
MRVINADVVYSVTIKSHQYLIYDTKVRLLDIR